VYQVAGSNDWSVLIVPIAELILVGVFEEVLFRGVFFRIIEQSLGSWIALVLSALIFVAAHLPGEGMSLLGGLAIFSAGIFFGAAYMVTRRLWFPIGIHIAWNYCLSTVFSVTVSGHVSQGLLQGSLLGPEWLAGGIFGVEGSAVTIVVISAAALYFLVRARWSDSIVRPYWRTRPDPHLKVDGLA
jgi:hypothetical protein